MPAAFWNILIIGIICTAVPAYNSYDKNKDDQKEAIRKTALITICGVIATLTLAIAASFIYDWIKSKNTDNDIDESIPIIEIGSGGTSTSQQNGVGYTLDGSDTLLYQRLKDKVANEILCFVSEDFDDDGEKEAFAIVGKESFGVWEGHLYFINKKSIVDITFDNSSSENERQFKPYNNTFRDISFGKQKAIAFSLYSATCNIDEVYGVVDGEPMKYNIPDVNGYFQVTDRFITLTVDAYDGTCDENYNWEGIHTWKPYYFFWNDSLKSFSEYGGIEITLEQLSKVKDVSRLMNQYYEDGYDLVNIIYRANKIVNINFKKKDSINWEGNVVYSHVYVTLYIQNDSIYLSNEEILEERGGYYLTAVKPEIAVYPIFPY